MDTHRILILGGTTEGRLLAERLASRADTETLVSLAGRTLDPRPLTVATRSGGFGGPEKLAEFLVAGAYDLLIDATHPFAERISRNAAEAARLAGIRGFAVSRPPWEPVDGDRWTVVTDPAQAIAALGAAPRRVFLAIGRQEAHLVEQAPQHAYVVRSIDPVDPPLAVPHLTSILSAGPFDEASEIALLQQHDIDVLVTKNSGGSATYAKIAAARTLGIAVIMVARPEGSGLPMLGSIDAALELIDHWLPPGRNRGV